MSVIEFPSGSDGEKDSVDLNQTENIKPKAPINMKEHTNPLIRKYKERKFKLVYYPIKTKIPQSEGWQEKDAPIEEYKGQNVGVILGTELSPGHYLVDIDFDWIPGIELSSTTLPRTGFFFGHSPSKPISHAFYATPEPVVYHKYTNIKYDPNDGVKHIAESECCFVELRGVTEKLKLGYQTMVPPSIWVSKDGFQTEKLEFYGKATIDSEITLVDALPRRTLLFAIACLLHANIGVGEFKHDMRMACAGYFLSMDLTREESLAVMKTVMEHNGPHDRGDEVTAVDSTIRALTNKKVVAGRSVLARLIGHYGNRVVSQITKWLGGSEFIESKGKVVANQENIRRAFEMSNVSLSYDEFSDKILISYLGENGTGYKGEINDNIRNQIRFEIERKYRFLPMKELYNDVTDVIAHENKYHPVLQYFDTLKWDGVERLATWVITSANAADTPYVRAVSSIVLKAAVKRVLNPGCKYDEMVVFESGTQGLMKSTALRVLCPKEEWFSDNLPLNLTSKELLELTSGKLIMEISELNKMRTAQMEFIKALLSRQEDTARLAYRRDAGTRLRHFIFIGTTNSYTYLSDQTGNRRFWPIRVQKFDVKWIKENREQLWAEAYYRVQNGESIRLPEHLYQAAEVEQGNRLVEDEWRNILDVYFENQYQRVAMEEIRSVLRLDQEKCSSREYLRIAEIMQSLGFEKAGVRDKDGKNSKGYKRDRRYSEEEWKKMREELAPGDEHENWDPTTKTMKPTEEQQRVLDNLSKEF
jgi:predicted P-loop ATPase